MKRVIPALAAMLLFAAPANAQPYDFELPQRWNEDLAPGSHCATPGMTDTFTPKGDLVKNLSRSYGWKYVHQVSWSLNQVVGPYTLDAGKQGRLVWGFTMLDGDAQDVKCSADQVWEPVGKPYEFSVPEARYSELKVDESSL